MVICGLHIFYVYLFPTCQVRVARFYVSLLLLLLFVLFSSFVSSFVVVLSALKRQPRQPSFVVVVLSALNHDHLRSVFPAGPQPRSSALCVPCRTSTASRHVNRDHLSPVFPAGPQPRPSASSVPCRTSTATI